MSRESKLLGPAFLPNGIAERKQREDDEHKALRREKKNSMMLPAAECEMKRQL